MARNPKLPLHVAGIIERYDNHVLIALPKADGVSRLWQLPRGPASHGESPETAIRRTLRDNLGIDVEVSVGQPPLVERVDGKDTELRYFFCGLAAGEAGPGPYAEIRWVPKAHLREYEFDAPSQCVVQWLLES